MCVSDGKAIRARQGFYRCALPGFPERLWGETKSGYYMGALPIYEGPKQSDEPPETSEEGCPGAWYRARFVRSIEKYERPVSADGVYSENPIVTRCTDPLVLAAVHHLEIERARCLSWQRDRMFQ